MNSHQETELLSAYMDGALPSAQNHELKAHIEGCPACQRELHELHALKGTLKSLSRKAMPARVVTLILQAAERKLAPVWKTWIVLPRIMIPAAGLAAAILMAGVWLWHGKSSEDAIPVESLLAAHHRYLEEGSLPPADLSADGFSAKLATYQNDADESL